ncbi:hypothetical protein PF003_g33483 [Phytophthora fragariae]|nr:hypothetical protein PF003_g33483 [Phytophthora fragariae]
MTGAAGTMFGLRSVCKHGSTDSIDVKMDTKRRMIILRRLDGAASRRDSPEFCTHI